MDTAIIGNGRWSKILQPYIKEKFNIIEVCDSKSNLNKVWENNKIKSVFIVTPIETHYKLIKQAISFNKKVFVEKPITSDYNQALELLNIKNNIFINYQYTFSEKLKQFKTPDFIHIILHRDNSEKYKDINVHWVLSPHIISVISMFFPLYDIKFDNYDLHNGIIEGPRFIASVSLDSERSTMFKFWYKQEYKLFIPEEDLLRNSVDNFYKMCNNDYISNVNLALDITRVIDNNL